MFGCAPGGGPTTLLGGPLRSKAPQQTFPPASCPDGKPVPPASCPDGKPVQTAGRSRRQAGPDGKPPFLPAFCQTSPAFRSRATPNLPCPTAPTFCRRAIALRPHPRLSPASHTQKPPPGRATLTPHSAALLRPRHHPNAAPAPPRPVILPESAGPTTLAPLPALHSLLLRLRRAGLAAPHPRVHALAQHAPLTLNHNSHAHLHTRLTAPQQTASALFRAVAVATGTATGTGPGPDQAQKDARTTQGAGVGITE